MASHKISNFWTPSLPLSPQLILENHSKSSFLIPLSSLSGVTSFMNGPLGIICNSCSRKKNTKILKKRSSVKRFSRNATIYSPQPRPKVLKIRHRLVGAVFKKITAIMSVVKENEKGKYQFCSF